jgi:hypothetical protein
VKTLPGASQGGLSVDAEGSLFGESATGESWHAILALSS